MTQTGKNYIWLVRMKSWEISLEVAMNAVCFGRSPQKRTTGYYWAQPCLTFTSLPTVPTLWLLLFHSLPTSLLCFFFLTVVYINIYIQLQPFPALISFSQLSPSPAKTLPLNKPLSSFPVLCMCVRVSVCVWLSLIRVAYGNLGKNLFIGARSTS